MHLIRSSSTREPSSWQHLFALIVLSHFSIAIVGSIGRAGGGAERPASIGHVGDSSEEASESSRISISGLVVSVSSGEDATLPLDMVMNPFSIFELRTT